MAAKVKETPNLGVPQFLKGVTPQEESHVSGFYLSDRIPHRSDGKPSNADFLPAGLLTQSYPHEETKMATTPSTKTPGSDLGTPPNAKSPMGKNLDPANQTGSTPPKPGNGLK